MSQAANRYFWWLIKWKYKICKSWLESEQLRQYNLVLLTPGYNWYPTFSGVSFVQDSSCAHCSWTVLTHAPCFFFADTGPSRTNIYSAITTASPTAICDWVPLTKLSISQPTGASTLCDAKTGYSSQWQCGMLSFIHFVCYATWLGDKYAHLNWTLGALQPICLVYVPPVVILTVLHCTHYKRQYYVAIYIFSFAL
jgi:hypothetical protein